MTEVDDNADMRIHVGTGGWWSPRLLALITVACCVGIAGCANSSRNGYPPKSRSGCFAFRVTTDRTSYGARSAVHIAVAGRNVTTRPCAEPGCGGLTGGYVVTDARGAVVFRQNPVGIACVANPPPPPKVRAGAPFVFESFTWDRRGAYRGVCRPGNCHPTRRPVPDGRYRVVWRWLSAGAASPWFTLRS